ncbi:MAG: hypothetical protein JXR40_05580 [Pontiellaceae bacterium]|nr:hypothetical protein [Pontiellaceae bacterium]
MNSQRTIYRITFWMAALIVAATFFVAGTFKIADLAFFANKVYRFQLLPEVFVNLVAIYLPWVEVVSASCLLFVPRFRTAALWILLLSLIVFIIGIGINLARGADFSCGCFGRNDDAPLSILDVFRNSGLIALTIIALICKRKIGRLSP